MNTYLYFCFLFQEHFLCIDNYVHVYILLTLHTIFQYIKQRFYNYIACKIIIKVSLLKSNLSPFFVQIWSIFDMLYSTRLHTECLWINIRCICVWINTQCVLYVCIFCLQILTHSRLTFHLLYIIQHFTRSNKKKSSLQINKSVFVN